MIVCNYDIVELFIVVGRSRQVVDICMNMYFYHYPDKWHLWEGGIELLGGLTV